MKKNLVVNIIFYLVLFIVIIKTFSTLLLNFGDLSNFKIIVYILLISVYILLGYMYYRRNIKKNN